MDHPAEDMSHLFSSMPMPMGNEQQRKVPNLFTEIKKNMDFTQEETLDPDKYELNEELGCYCNFSSFVIHLEMSPNLTEPPIGFHVDVIMNGDTLALTLLQIPAKPLKIDFHGSGYFTDHFVHQLLLNSSGNSWLDMVQVVDVSGCVNLTDTGVTWLARLLKDCINLHTILLAGCFGITGRGVATLQQLIAVPTMSLLGTGVATLPPYLWTDETQLQGCPLLQMRDRDDADAEDQVPVRKLVIHPANQSTCSLSSLLTAKVNATPATFQFLRSWQYGGVEYTIMETTLNEQMNRYFTPYTGEQVLIPVNIDGSLEKCLGHIKDTINYHMANDDGLVTYQRRCDPCILVPRLLVTALWDAAHGRLIFLEEVDTKLNLWDTIDGKGEHQIPLSSAVLSVTSNIQSSIKFIVDCDHDTPMNIRIAIINGGYIDHSSKFDQFNNYKQLVFNGDVVELSVGGRSLTCTINGEKNVYPMDREIPAGFFTFLISSMQPGSIQFLDPLPPKAYQCGVNQGRHELLRSVRRDDEAGDDKSLFDYTNGIVWSESGCAEYTTLHPVSKNNSNISVKVQWAQTESMFQARDATREHSKMVRKNIKKVQWADNISTVGYEDKEGLVIGLKAYAHGEIPQEEGQNPSEPYHLMVTEHFVLEDSATDIFSVEIPDLETYIEPDRGYTIYFYRNNTLLHKKTFINDSGDELMAPVFVLSIGPGTSVQILDYSPPAWFCAQMDLASRLPDHCFVLPGILRKSSVNATDSNMTVMSSSMALTSLTVHHPGFEVIVDVSKDDASIVMSANPRDLSDIACGHRFMRPAVGDVIGCSVIPEGLTFDQFGIPVINQKITLIYTLNGHQVHEQEIYYRGGGLHPTLHEMDVCSHFKNMDLAEATRICAHRMSLRKQFVVVGTTQEMQVGECDDRLKELQLLVLDMCTQSLKQADGDANIIAANYNSTPPNKEHEKWRQLIHSTDGNTLGRLGYCQENMKTRLLMTAENWRNLNQQSSPVVFIALNTENMQGYDRLCEIIEEGQRTMSKNAPDCRYSVPVRNAIKEILRSDSNRRIVCGDDCGGTCGLPENKIKAVLKALHAWGKVIFLVNMTPWVAILDVEWFVNIILKLRTSKSATVAEGNVRGLNPATPIWEARHLDMLINGETAVEKKLLLDVLVQYHELVQLVGFRSGCADANSYFVNPCHIMEPSVPLTHFSHTNDEGNWETVSVRWVMLPGLDTFCWQAVLCSVARLSPPIVLSRSFMVQQIGASQVVLRSHTPKPGAGYELSLEVQTYHPSKESASKGIVNEYTCIIVNLLKDIISHTLLKDKRPFAMCFDQEMHPANLSICSSHRWSARVGDLHVSVCTLCSNCSQHGVECRYNRMTGPYDVHCCQCNPHILCCQDCGLCQACVQSLWGIRSALRPCIESRPQMATESVFSCTNITMTPAIFNEATVVKIKQAESINIGLLCEDGEQFVQLFPGRASVGRKDQGYHEKTRHALTENHVNANPKMSFDLGDQITVQLTEPLIKSLDQLGVAGRGNTGDFCVNLLYKVNCSFSRVTNIVRSTTRMGLGMLVSHLPASNKCLYFEAEIVSFSSKSFAGVGMIPSTVEGNLAECIGHGTGSSLTSGCLAWSNQHWQVGDLVGCATCLDGDDSEQVVVFSHNDKIVCKHGPVDAAPLHAAVLVGKDDALCIIPSDIWNNPTTHLPESQSQMPADQEIFESSDGTVRICPMNNLIFHPENANGKSIPTSVIYIENNSSEYLLWKIRTSKDGDYISNPNKGILRSGEMAVIRNEYKSVETMADIASDRFQIAYLVVQKYEVDEDLFDLETVTQLWQAKKDQGIAEIHHKVKCSMATTMLHVEQTETNYAEELDGSKNPMVEPSYCIRVLKNGGLVGSYWLPKKAYRFAIESEKKLVIQEDIMVHMPKLPVLDPHDGFRVGMMVTAILDKDEDSSETVWGMCQVDRVEAATNLGDPAVLHLTHHQEAPGSDTPPSTLTLPVDSPRLQPFSQWRATSDGNTQVAGYIANTNRLAPDHLFKHTEFHSKGNTYVGMSCENLLFGAHMIALWRDQLTPMMGSGGERLNDGVMFDASISTKAMPQEDGLAYMFLPEQLTTDTLLYPSLRQLHDFSALNIYPVCQVAEHPGSEDWHMMDSCGYFPEGTINYTNLYHMRLIIYNYIHFATKKMRLPTYKQLIKGDNSMPQHQVEALLQSMVQTYALTAQLLMIPHYMKVANITCAPTWETQAILPLDFQFTCSTHTAESWMKHSGPYAELVRHLWICGQDGEDSAAAAGSRPADTFIAMDSDLEGSLSKSPWLQTLLLEGTVVGRDVHLSLPELTEVINTSMHSVYIDNCPKLKVWEGSMRSNTNKQLQLITRCKRLERLDIHENCIESLPEEIGQLQMLTTFRITHSHLTHLPASFTSLKNLKHLLITGPVANWNNLPSSYTGRVPTLDKIKSLLPYVSEKAILTTLKANVPNWEGSESSVWSPDQRGKATAALYSLSRSLGQNAEGMHGEFPRQILQLTSLRHLQLSHQAIRTIPAQISRLKHLEILELDGCLNLEDLPSTLGFLPLKRLSFQGCVSLRTPSRETLDLGTEAVLAHLKQMASGKSQNWRTKLMLVGIGGAGKTTLLRALRSSTNKAKATTEQEITHGIDIETWTARDEKRHPGKEVKFSAWDFAGQTVFYHTHQFFLSDRAVYLLVWSTRQGFDNSGLEFWLSSIQCHAPQAPVFIIATHADRLTTDLPRGHLHSIYSQIHGFYFVGSTTGKGIIELRAAILDVALDLDYMGEDVPTVYLDLEQQLLALRGEETPYIKWSLVKEYAMQAGIFDEKDVGRAVQFLQQIGSVQYFDYDVLRDYVVINPQWIVGAMASVVTFKDSVIKNGRLYHKHMAQLWKQYPESLHEWLLRLTEMFDLTFQISKDLSIVPCLLSNEKPDQAKWPPRADLEGTSMMLIVYMFRYLPTGLFNRLQARLFEFSNGKTVWRRGSILEKKGHYAYIKHEGDEKLAVQVLGQHPENILFLIHETLEDLINLSYRGIQFDYLIPCPDCFNAVGMESPAMFEASMVREATKYAAPYLQCKRLFHTVPMATVKGLMPPDDNQELDLQLQRSMQSLGEMRNNLQTDIFILVAPADLPTPAERKTNVDPRIVVQNLKENFTCFYDENIDAADVQSLMVSMKAAKTLLVFISNNFVKNAHCSQLLQYAHTAFQDRYGLVNLSPDYGWKAETAGFILSQKVFINMKKYDKESFKVKMEELENMLRVQLGQATKKGKEDPVIFVSYSWNNSEVANTSRKITKKEATACDPRKMKVHIEKETGMRCWLDVEQVGKKGLFEDITEGLRAADVLVAFVSNEYLNSANCMMELRFAVSTLRLPVIFIAVGIGMEWQFEEIGTLQRNAKADCVDMRQEVTNEDANVVMEFVKNNILTSDQRQKKRQKLKSKTSQMSIVELTNIAYHEEFELAQRKLMRRLAHLANHQATIPYPRIFTLDFMDSKGNTADIRTSRKQRPDSVSTTRQRSRPRSYMKKRDSVLTSSTNEVSTSSPNADEDALWLDDTFCIRFLCEHDQGWHMTAEILELKGLTLHQKEFLLGNVAPYLARMLTILNHSSVPLNCQRGDEGAAFKQYLVKLAMEAETSDVFEKSYLELLQYVIGHDLNHSRGGLKKCILSGGRIRWLCPSHQKGYRVTVLTTDVAHRSRSQKTDTEYLKGLTEGLLEFRDKQPQLGVKEESQQNISDFLSVAHLDALTPRTSTLLDTSALIFRTSEADSDVFQVINQTTATLDSTSQADLGHVRESVANVLDAISESPPRESEPLQLAVAEPKVPHPSDTQKKSSLREHSQMPLRAIAHSVSSDSDTSESGPEAAISKQVEFNDAGKGKAPVNQTHAMRIKFPDSSDWDTSESRKKSATSESEKQNALTKGVLFNDTAQAEETRKKAAQRRLMELMARAKPLNPVVRPQKVTSRACVVM